MAKVTLYDTTLYGIPTNTTFIFDDDINNPQLAIKEGYMDIRSGLEYKVCYVDKKNMPVKGIMAFVDCGILKNGYIVHSYPINESESIAITLLHTSIGDAHDSFSIVLTQDIEEYENQRIICIVGERLRVG